MKTITTSCLLVLLNMFNIFSQSTWHLVPNTQLSSLSRIDDICFINDSTGFFGSNSTGSEGIYKTIDKGNTWSLIAATNTGYIRSIEFINDSVGFYGLIHNSPDSASLYKTTDGGFTWTRLTNMQMQMYDGICGLAHYGNSIIGVGTYYSPAWFYRSDDLGLTWTKINMSAFANGLVDCYMLNNDTILVSGIADSSNFSKATILKSIDGGLTWQRVFLSATPNSYCWKMFFRPNGLGLSSIESSSSIARTTDYGDTWTEIFINNTPSNEFGAIGLLNDTLGWVCSQSNFGNTATWQTTDGGLTWDSIYAPIEMGDRMVVIDSATALVSGNGIYKYDDIITTITQHNIVALLPHNLNIYPNIVTDYLTIDANATTQTFGLIDLLDASGKTVQMITRQVFIKGKNTFQVSVKQLHAGSYVILWRTNERFLTARFVVN